MLFRSDNLTNSIISNISQVADENVKNAVMSTRLYRAEMAEWEKAKKDSPDKYSQVNHAYAMQATQPWLQVREWKGRRQE